MSENNFSRRDFVRRSAAGIGGLAVAGYAARAAAVEKRGVTPARIKAKPLHRAPLQYPEKTM